MAFVNSDISRGKPGLACLALAVIEGDVAFLDSLADWLGYKSEEAKSDFVKKRPDSPNKAVSSTDKVKKAEIPSPKTAPRSYLPWPFWRVSKVSRSIAPEDSTGRPEWLKPDYQPPVLPQPAKQVAHCRLPWPEQLVAMHRVWPMLINDLSSSHKISKPDISRIIRLMADARSLPKVPRLERQKWSDDIHIVVDTASHLFPYRSDFMRLADSLFKRVGGRVYGFFGFWIFPAANVKAGIWIILLHNHTPCQTGRVVF